MNTDMDITIVGAGMIGLITACMLAKTNLRIAVIDRCAHQQRTDHDFDARTVAINHDHWQTLINLDIDLSAQAGVMQAMHVVDQATAADFTIDDSSTKQNLAYVLENRVLVSALHKLISTHNNIQMIAPLSIESIVTTKTGATIHCAETTMNTKLIIGADGKQSAVRRLSLIKVQERDYFHQAIVTVVKANQAHNNTAEQVFQQDDIVGLLPLHDSHHYALILSTPPEQARQLMSMTTAEFNCYISNAFSMRLGILTAVVPRHSITLTQQHAERYVQPRVALIGDAAHSLHPLAGLGANLGISDAKALVNTICNTMNKQRDIGLLTNLRAYERERQHKNADMLCLMQLFKEGFAEPNTLIKQLRAYGLKAFNSATLIKRITSKIASAQ